MGHLDDNGLLYLWNKIKSTFVAKVEGKGLSTNDFTTAEKNKLAGIAAGATANTGDMLKSTYDADGDGVVDKAEDANKVNGLTVQTAVPANAKFTDTVYTHPTSAGNKHIPSGGSSGQILRWSAAGTAAWGEDKNTTYDEFDGSLNKAGLVPKIKSDTNFYACLCSDGTWMHFGLEFEDGTLKLTRFKNGEEVGSVGVNFISTLESTFAKKSELVGLFEWKGSVANAAALPTTGQAVGDVYNIEAASTYGGAGANVVWNGTAWDALGEVFSVVSITNAEIDTICS